MVQLEGKRLLIVDDSPTNRLILTRQAASWGMTARDTSSPAEALRWIQQGDPFDIAILDMQMPDMDGMSLAREIRHDRDERSLPLVLLTSLGRREVVPSDLHLAAFLHKPIRPSQLLDVLMDVLGTGLALKAASDDGGALDQAPPRASQLRILVAEDNATNQQLARLLLQKIGYRADMVGNGLEALEALERQPYDVVLMDVQMPEMDGLEATRRIHLRWPGAERPRIIAVTANAMSEEREACLAAGMDDYVSKPIRLDHLVGALARVHPGTSLTTGHIALDQLKGSLKDDDLVDKVVDTFLATAPATVAGLRESYDRGDAEGLRRGAHTLKSNAATFRAHALAELCRDLESLAKDGRLAETPELIARVEEEFGRVRDELASSRVSP
jgi:CheY-like chemotaxis protein